MLWTLVWLSGIFLGYAIFMSQTPLRQQFSDSFNLVRERGNAHLWILVGVLSLAGAGLDIWRAFESGAVFSWGAVMGSPELQSVAPEVLASASSTIGDLFSTVVAGGSQEVGGGVRGVMVGILASLLVVAAALVLQYYILLVLYVKISSPSRKVKFSKLFELALRRFGWTWPLLLVCWAAWAVPVVGGVTGDARLWWFGGAALVFAVFAFLQVGVLSGERHLRDGIGFNFECWRGGWTMVVWFFVIALVNLCILALAQVSLERSIGLTTFPGMALKLAFVFVRSFVLVWLLGAWLLFFCDRFVGEKQPRPK